MKEIKQKNMKLLLNKNIVRHTRHGLMDARGNIVGFHRTKNKVYIEDWYADLAEKISQNGDAAYDGHKQRRRSY